MSEASRKGLETFEVPQGEGYNVITLTFTVYSDGSIELPKDLTPGQTDALRAYLTHNNEHMNERRGARLTMMSDEKAALLDTVIDAFKTPEQIERERITSWVLQQHTMQVSTYKAFVSWFEETYSRHKDEWIKEGACTQDDTLYEVHITESYDRTFSYRHNQVTTLYFVAVKPDSTIVIMHSHLARQDRETDADADE